MDKVLQTKVMRKAKILSLPKAPTLMVIESWSPPGWMEITRYTVRLADGSLMDDVRPEEIKWDSSSKTK